MYIIIIQTRAQSIYSPRVKYSGWWLQRYTACVSAYNVCSFGKTSFTTVAMLKNSLSYYEHRIVRRRMGNRSGLTDCDGYTYTRWRWWCCAAITRRRHRVPKRMRSSIVLIILDYTGKSYPSPAVYTENLLARKITRRKYKFMKTN